MVDYVLEWIDVGVTCGHRTEAEQNKAFKEGNSKVQYPNSRHNMFPSKAVDLVIYHQEFGYLWGTPEQFTLIAKVKHCTRELAETWFYMQYARVDTLMQTAARDVGVNLRWGGRWSHDNDLLDNEFIDIFHWEVVL